MLIVRVSLGLIMLAGAPALAAELEPESTIRSVTVFPVGATVVRTANVTLPVGPSVVVIDDLPAGMEADSLKVEGAGSNAFSIASVDARYVPASDTKDPEREALLSRMEAIQDRIGAVDDRLAALDGRRRFLEQLIEVTPEGFGKGIAEGANLIEQWATAATTIGDGLAAVADAARAARIERRGLEEQAAELDQQLAALRAPADRMAVRIAVAANAETSGTLSISYRTPYANWVPSYDAQLSTGENGAKPTLSIVRRAEVTQNSGEDWTDVALTLSTARTAGGTAAPLLDANVITAFESKFYGEAADMDSASTALARPMPAPELAAGAAEIAPQEGASHVLAAANFGDFRAEYVVPGAVSVEDGKGARSMQIATQQVAARIEVKAVPLLSEAAYLHAAFVPPEGAPFLPGKVSLFRDGVFVGNGEVPMGRAGRELNLGFGVDDLVRVTRVALERTTGEHGILSTTKTDTRRFKITVDNLHSFPVDITVLDRVPIAEDQKVQVVRLDNASEPTALNVDDRRGVLAWTYSYAPKETREIMNAYQVSWPADMQIVALD